MLDLATCGWRSQSDPWRCEEPSSFTKPTGHKEGFSSQKIAKPLRDVFSSKQMIFRNPCSVAIKILTFYIFLRMPLPLAASAAAYKVP